MLFTEDKSSTAASSPALGTTTAGSTLFTMSTNPAETSRRRSTFYVPLTITSDDVEENCENNNNLNINHNNNSNNKKTLDERIYNPDLSACSFDWSLDDSINNGDLLVSNEKENKFKRYGIVLNASVNIDDDTNDHKCHQLKSSSSTSSVHKHKQTSTPIRGLMKSRSRNNILTVTGSMITPPSLLTASTTTIATPTKVFYTEKNVISGTTMGVITGMLTKSSNASNNNLTSASSSTTATTNTCSALTTTAATSPTTTIATGSGATPAVTNGTKSATKEKSKTLPQNHQYSPINQVLPQKGSFLLKSTPRISLNYSSDMGGSGNNINNNNNSNHNLSISSSLSPKKSLSFIRRTHSTKLSRSNSLLKSLTSKCVDHTLESWNLSNVPVTELHFDRLNLILKTMDKLKTNDLLADIFLINNKDIIENSSSANTTATKNNSCGGGGSGLNDDEEDNGIHSGESNFDLAIINNEVDISFSAV